MSEYIRPRVASLFDRLPWVTDQFYLSPFILATLLITLAVYPFAWWFMFDEGLKTTITHYGGFIEGVMVWLLLSVIIDELLAIVNNEPFDPPERSIDAYGQALLDKIARVVP